ncbi:MAG: hypothetical protein C0490_18475 [Marivirga sp.]|nr:hypothetical protein [Marivirga sp.]
MSMQTIPDVRYAISDDGQLINIEQGEMEPSCVQLHRIHVKHFAELMKVGQEDERTSPMLVDYLERINEQAASLYNYLSAIPGFPTNAEYSEDVMMAKNLYETANKALAYWGNN